VKPQYFGTISKALLERHRRSEFFAASGVAEVGVPSFSRRTTS
jgi:hypothetical protein